MKLGLILAAFFLALVWIPFLWLSWYNVPIGMHEWDWMTNEAGQLPHSWWDQQHYIYTGVMGRYTSNALLSLTSFWCTLQAFPVFFFCWHLVWILILLIAIKSIASAYSWQKCFLLLVGIQTLYIFYLEDVYDSLFRYVGVLTYQLGFLLMLLSGIFFIRAESNKGIRILNFILGFLFLGLSIGANEMNMLYGVLGTCVIWIFKRFISGSNSKVYFAALLYSIFCALIVILAPGNTVRLQSEHGGMNVLNLLITTFGSSANLWFDWLSNGMLIWVSLLAIPVLWMKGEMNFGFSLFNDYRPWLILLLLIVPLSMGLLMYSTGGDAFPERIIDHLFIHVLFLWLGLLISLSRKFHLPEVASQLGKNKIVQFGFFILLLVTSLHVFGDGISVDRSDKSNHRKYLSLIQSNSNITNAWLTLWKGDAQTYHQESLYQLSLLRQCHADTCYIDAPSILPKMLYDPFSDRRNRRGDPFIGYYFNPGINFVKYQTIRGSGN